VAKKQQPQSRQKRKGLSNDQLDKIWSGIDAHDWEAIAQTNKPQNGFALLSQDIIRGCCPCPDHPDNAPSFFIYVAKHYAKCYGSNCNYYTSNPVSLMAVLLNKTEPEALDYIQNRYNFTFLSKKTISELEDQRLNQLTKQAIYVVTHELMCEAVSQQDNPEYLFAKDALDWLVNTRQIPLDSLHCLPLGIMPEIGKVSKRIHDNYVAAYDYWKSTESTAPAPEELSTLAIDYLASVANNPSLIGSLVFPMHTTPSTISRFKLRIPKADIKKDFVFLPDDFSDADNLGVYGLGWQPYKDRSEERRVGKECTG